MFNSPLYSTLDMSRTQNGFEIEVLINIQHPLIQDHLVQDKLVVSGAYWLESMLSLVTHETQDSYDVSNLLWLIPLTLHFDPVPIRFKATKIPDGFSVQVTSSSQEIAQAQLIRRDDKVSGKNKIIPISRLQDQATLTVGHEQIYDAFAAIGFGYGPAYRVIESLWCFDQWSLSKLLLNADTEGYVLHPAIVDAALQTSLGISYARGSKEKAHLPFSIKSIRCYHPLTQARYIYALENAKQKNSVFYHLFFLSAEGEVLVFMQDFIGRRPLKP